MSSVQTHAIYLPREILSDAEAYWYAAEKIRKASQFEEVLKTLWENSKGIVSWEIFHERQLTKLCFTAEEALVEPISAALYAIVPSAQIKREEDFTQRVKESDYVLTSEVTAAQELYMPFLTFQNIQSEIMSPNLNTLSILPVKQRIIIQYVAQPYPDTWRRALHMRLSRFKWLTKYVRTPWRWCWNGAWAMQKFGGIRMTLPMFWMNMRIAVIQEPEDGLSEEGARAEMDLSMNAVRLSLRYLDFMFHGVLSERKRAFGYEHIFPFQDRDLTRPFIFSHDELSSLYHPVYIETHPFMAQALAITINPPAALTYSPTMGEAVHFADCVHHGKTTPIGIREGDRVGHLHVIGKSGVGKSKLLEIFMSDDAETGRGFALIDCHGDMFDEVLSIIPESRIDDVVLFDFSSSSWIPLFNPFSAPVQEERNLLVKELADLLCGFQGKEVSERIRKFVRNAIAITSESPEPSFGALLRFFRDPDFRAAALTDTPARAAAEFFETNEKDIDTLLAAPQLSELVQMLARLLATDVIANALERGERGIDFQDLLASKKIVLVRLPKHTLGNEAVWLLGSLFLFLFSTAGQARADSRSPGERAYSIYVDEFQNFCSERFVRYLDDARSRGLQFILAHQTLRQLDPEILDSLRERIQNTIAFQMGGDDARRLKDLFSPTVDPIDVTNLDLRCFYGKLTSKGQPVEVVNGRTIDFAPLDPNFAAECVKRSRELYSARGEEHEEGGEWA